MSQQSLSRTYYFSKVRIKIFKDAQLQAGEGRCKIKYYDFNTLESELRQLEDLYPAPIHICYMSVDWPDGFDMHRLTPERYSIHGAPRFIIMEVHRHSLPARPWVRRAA